MCVRVETYKHPETDDMMTKMFRGKLPNSAFCLFDPTGKKQLCKPSRTPHSLTNSKVGQDYEGVVREMKKIAARYQVKNSPEPPLLQDFNSLEESLNISAGDQRLLVLLHSSRSEVSDLLRKVVSNQHMTGRFHVDRISSEDEGWGKLLDKQPKTQGILIVRPGQFGLKGQVMNFVPENATAAQLSNALVAANKQYAKTEKRRDREEHVAAGNREGVSYDLEKPDHARTEILRGGGRRKISVRA